MTTKTKWATKAVVGGLVLAAVSAIALSSSPRGCLGNGSVPDAGVDAGIASIAAPSADIVRDFHPVSREFAAIARGTVEGLLSLENLAERQAYLKQHAPDLGERVVRWLFRIGALERGTHEVERVELLFGSVDDATALDGNGTVNRGKLVDQLVARVKIVGVNTPRDFVVECLNGMVRHDRTWPTWADTAAGRPTPENDPLQGLATVQKTENPSPWPLYSFTLGEYGSLARQVGIWHALAIAEQVGLKVYRGVGRDISPETRISYQEARRIARRQGDSRVTILTRNGDAFSGRQGADGNLILDTIQYTPVRR